MTDTLASAVVVAPRGGAAPRVSGAPAHRAATKPWMLGGAGDRDDEPRGAGNDGANTATAFADETTVRGRAFSPRWTYVPVGLAVAASAWAASVLGNRQAALMAVFASMAAGAVAAICLMAGMRSLARQMRALAHVIHADDSAAAGRRQAAPALCAEFEPLSREIFLHLNRLGESLRRSHDKGVQLGTRLAETQQRVMTLALEHDDGGILALDDARRVLMANHAARMLLEFPEGDVLRRPLGELLGDQALLRQFEETQASLLHSRRVFDHQSANRTLRISLVSVVGQGDAASAVNAAAHVTLAFVHDATRELAQAKATADFVSHVAHELRTPLSSLRAYVEMLVDGEASDEKTQRQYYEIIHSETDRMSRLIDDILNVARIESGVVKVSKQPLALAVITQDVINVMQPQADKKGIRLIGQLAPVMHQVMADKDMIHECLLNLVSNAVKYTPDGGAVTVRMRVNEQERTITTDVIDSGIGIPAEDLPRMFEKFFRPKANAKMAKGTGLGLNLVRNIVETVHGGKVGLISAQGKGSTFSMTLSLT